jgi:PAS domain S-box-containing protein
MEKNRKKTPLAKEREKAKRKLEELNDWQKRYKSLVMSSPYAVTLTDLGGKIIDFSRRTLIMHGYRRRDELLGKSALALIAPKDRKRAGANIQKTLEKGFVKNVEYTMLRKDGKSFIGELDASLVKDSKGKPAAFIATVRNVTKQRQSESALKRSEERYKSLFELNPQAVVTVNLKGVITSCNPAAEKMTGISRKNLVGKNALKLKALMKQDLPRLGKILLSLAKGKVPEPFECGFYHKDGSLRWALVNVALFDEGGGKKGIQAVVTDITAHVNAESALRESEEKYKAIFDRSLHSVFVHDLEGVFTDANKAAQELLGYRKGEVGKLNFADLLDADQLPLAQKTVADILKTGHQKQPTRYRLRRKDGQHVWIESESSLIYRKGIPHAVLGIAKDITEYKLTEEALRESEKKYRNIFESLTDVYYRTDREGIVTEISPSVTTQAGWDQEEVIGQPVTDFYRDPSAREIFANTLSQKGVINDYELQLLAKDGRVIEVSASSRIMHDDRGQVAGVEGVLRDITARKQMERALRESEEKFRMIVEHSLQGIIIIQDFQIKYANEAFVKIAGYEIDELLDLSPGQVKQSVHPEDQDLVWGRMTSRLEGKEVPSRYKYRGIKKDGSIRWLEMVVNRIEYQGRPAVQGAIIDVSDRQQAMEKIQASLEEKEVMLREIHHRVKNNMQIILSLLRIQSRGAKDRETLEMFRQSLNRIRSMALIHEALYKSGDLARIDIADYISGMTTHLMSIYREDLGDVEIVQEAEGVFLDINRAIPCGLIISELVSNCLKHAFPKYRRGRISIRMTVDKKGKNTLSIKDNGVGFPEDLNFRETETLGMQLVTDLVKQIHGTISLKKAEGTDFVIRF